MQKCQNKLTKTLKLHAEFELMPQILFPPHRSYLSISYFSHNK